MKEKLNCILDCFFLKSVQDMESSWSIHYLIPSLSTPKQQPSLKWKLWLQVKKAMSTIYLEKRITLFSSNTMNILLIIIMNIFLWISLNGSSGYRKTSNFNHQLKEKNHIVQFKSSDYISAHHCHEYIALDKSTCTSPVFTTSSIWISPLIYCHICIHHIHYLAWSVASLSASSLCIHLWAWYSLPHILGMLCHLYTVHPPFYMSLAIICCIF